MAAIEDDLLFSTNELKTEYLVTETNGTVTAFTTGGLLKEIRYADGNDVAVERDADGLQTAICAPSGFRLLVTIDSDGNQQVENRFDKEDRVIWQRDGAGGEYTLTYYEDHTVTTDAQGRTSEVWFDAQKRTVRKTDAERTHQLRASTTHPKTPFSKSFISTLRKWKPLALPKAPTATRCKTIMQISSGQGEILFRRYRPRAETPLIW